MDLEVESCVRGHHVYSSIWTPELEEALVCERELDNTEDRYAVAVLKDEVIIGHIPRKILFFAPYLSQEEAQSIA